MRTRRACWSRECARDERLRFCIVFLALFSTLVAYVLFANQSRIVRFVAPNQQLRKRIAPNVTKAPAPALSEPELKAEAESEPEAEAEAESEPEAEAEAESEPEAEAEAESEPEAEAESEPETEAEADATLIPAQIMPSNLVALGPVSGPALGLNCNGWTIMEESRHWRSSHVLVITVFVHRADSHAKTQYESCTGCRVYGVLRSSDGSKQVQVVADYSPVLTDKVGRLKLTFRVGSFNGISKKEACSLYLFASVYSIRGVETSVVNSSTCQWSLAGDNDTARKFTDTEIWSGFCTLNEVKPVLGAGAIQMPASSPVDSCTPAFRGEGRWDVDLAQDRKTTLYNWRPGGCPLPPLTSFCSSKKMRIAFVGDSILRNLFFEWVAWAEDKPCTYGNIPYSWNHSSMQAQYFETYGYYPLKSFSSSDDKTCCGEPDCVRRQQARAPRLGFPALKRALEWLGEVDYGTVLIVRSPIVHQARAYVSDEEHMAIVGKIISKVKLGIKQRKLTIWVSATSHEPRSLKKKYMENRQARRYRMHLMESKLVEKVKGLSLLSLWNMSVGRHDRFWDGSHVFPTNNRPYSHTIGRTWVAMLNSVLIERGVLCSGSSVVPVAMLQCSVQLPYRL